MPSLHISIAPSSTDFASPSVARHGDNLEDRDMRKKKIVVGSRVRFHFGSIAVIAEVIEDRGNLAVGRKRLLRVRFDLPGAEAPTELEIPEERVELAA
jgi:hypothetical protein